MNTITITRPATNNAARHLWTKFSSLARKAVRLGVQPPAFLSETHEHEVIDENGGVRMVVDVQISIPEPVQVNGWSAIGVVKLGDQIDDIFSHIPSKVKQIQAKLDAPDRGQGCNRCDHCNAGRNRGTLICVENTETSKMMLLGKECTKFYTRDGADELKFLKFVTSMTEELRGIDFGPARTFRSFDTYEAATLVLDNVAEHGFVKSRNDRGDINEDATWRVVLAALQSHGDSGEITIGPETDQLVQFFRNLETEDPFLLNLKTACSKDRISERNLTILAAAPDCMRREILRAEEAAAPEPSVQAPEGRVKVRGKVLSVKDYENDFGVTFKMLVQLIDGNKVFCSVPSFSNIGKGDEIEFTASFERKEPHFSIGKRPAKAQILTPAA